MAPKVNTLLPDRVLRLSLLAAGLIAVAVYVFDQTSGALWIVVASVLIVLG